MVLLDTCFIIDLLRNRGSAVDYLGHLMVNTEPMVISATTVFELNHGIERGQRPENERNKVASVLSDIGIANINHEIAATAGRLRGASMNSGNPIPSLDCLIAATALVLKEPLLTRDQKHFEGIEGLVTTTW